MAWLKSNPALCQSHASPKTDFISIIRFVPFELGIKFVRDWKRRDKTNVNQQTSSWNSSDSPYMTLIISKSYLFQKPRNHTSFHLNISLSQLKKMSYSSLPFLSRFFKRHVIAAGISWTMFLKSYKTSENLDINQWVTSWKYLLTWQFNLPVY